MRDTDYADSPRSGHAEYPPAGEERSGGAAGAYEECGDSDQDSETGCCGRYQDEVMMSFRVLEQRLDPSTGR